MRRVLVHALHFQQVLGRFRQADLLFLGDGAGQQQIARPVPEFVHQFVIELLDGQQFLLRHVGDLFQVGEAFLHQDRGHVLIHRKLFHEQLDGVSRLLGAFFLGRLLGHDVQLPAGELGGQPHVLAAASDGLGKLFFVHDHVHAVRFFIHHDGLYFGRCERIDHVLCRVIRPVDDVHAFAGELVRHALHA